MYLTIWGVYTLHEYFYYAQLPLQISQKFLLTSMEISHRGHMINSKLWAIFIDLTTKHHVM